MNAFLAHIRECAALQHRVRRVDWQAQVQGLVELHAPRLAEDGESIEQAEARLAEIARREMGWPPAND